MTQQEQTPAQFTEFPVTVRKDVFTVVPNGFCSSVYDPEGDLLFDAPWELNERQAVSIIAIWITAFDDGVESGKHQKAREIVKALGM